MALSTDDVNAVRAQWEEWTADKGFRLSIEVKSEEPDAVMVEASRGVDARLDPKLYLQVEIWRTDIGAEARELFADAFEVPARFLGSGKDKLVFSERVPFDAEMLRASVSVLARTIGNWSP